MRVAGKAICDAIEQRDIELCCWAKAINNEHVKIKMMKL
jgi:hypothetical protein